MFTVKQHIFITSKYISAHRFLFTFDSTLLRHICGRTFLQSRDPFIISCWAQSVFCRDWPERIPSCSISSIFSTANNGRTNDRIYKPLSPQSSDSLTHRFISPCQPTVYRSILLSHSLLRASSSTAEDSRRRIGSFRTRQRRLVIPKVFRRLRNG